MIVPTMFAVECDYCVHTKTLLLKVRPKHGGPWLYTTPEDLAYQLLDLDVTEGTGYEAELVHMTEDEIDNLPEFEGW